MHDSLAVTAHAAAQGWEAVVGFVLLGLLGFVFRMLLVFRGSGGKKLGAFDNYVEENSVNVLLALIAYLGIVALWLWTDTFGLLGGVGDWLGIKPHILNGWTFLFGILSDYVLFKLIDLFGDKLGADKLSEKVNQFVPKMAKTEGDEMKDKASALPPAPDKLP